MLRLGIVGLPNVGKSTLFNALTSSKAAAAENYPFCTVDPNVGVVEVPDPRLDQLVELVKPKKKVPAVVEFVDIAGLVKGASKGEGLGNQFLSHIREVDAIIHVLRDFKDENVVRAGSENPDSDRETIETELAIADLLVIDKLIDGLRKESKEVPKVHNSEKMVPILEEIKSSLEQGKKVGKFEVGDEQIQKWFSSLPLLSIKPVLYIYNVAEDEYQARLNSDLGG